MLIGGIPLPTAFTKTINEIPCKTNATTVIAIPIAKVLITAEEENVKFSLLIWHKSAIALFVDVTRFCPRSPLRTLSIIFSIHIRKLEVSFRRKEHKQKPECKGGNRQQVRQLLQ